MCEEDVHEHELIEHPQLTNQHIIADAQRRRRPSSDLHSMYGLLLQHYSSERARSVGQDRSFMHWWSQSLFAIKNMKW